MKVRLAFILLTAVSLTVAADAQVEFLPGVDSPDAFSDRPRLINVLWHNPGTKTVFMPVYRRLYEASSATAMPLENPVFWKQLQILPGQTVLESDSVIFPPVKSANPFLLQWLDASNKILGASQVMVYPTNLLDELKTMLAGERLKIFDPQDQIKPALNRLAMPMDDLQDAGLENVSGKLVLIGPVNGADSSLTAMSARIRKLSRRGVGVVWLQSFPAPPNRPQPSFFLMPGEGAVIAQPGLVEKLDDTPRSQLNLIYFCKLALRLDAPGLPELNLNQ